MPACTIGRASRRCLMAISRHQCPPSPAFLGDSAWRQTALELLRAFLESEPAVNRGGSEREGQSTDWVRLPWSECPTGLEGRRFIEADTTTALDQRVGSPLILRPRAGVTKVRAMFAGAGRTPGRKGRGPAWRSYVSGAHIAKGAHREQGGAAWGSPASVDAKRRFSRAVDDDLPPLRPTALDAAGCATTSPAGVLALRHRRHWVRPHRRRRSSTPWCEGIAEGSGHSRNGIGGLQCPMRADGGGSAMISFRNAAECGKGFEGGRFARHQRGNQLKIKWARAAAIRETSLYLTCGDFPEHLRPRDIVAPIPDSCILGRRSGQEVCGDGCTARSAGAAAWRF